MGKDFVKQGYIRLKKRLAGEIKYIKIWQRRINTISGTKAGGLKAAKTNKMRHGDDFYKRIGHQGGSNGHNGGFASGKVGKDGLTGPERAKLAGAEGGRKSVRGSSHETLAKIRENHTKITEMLRNGETLKEISRATGIPVNTLSRKIEKIGTIERRLRDV